MWLTPQSLIPTFSAPPSKVSQNLERISMSFNGTWKVKFPAFSEVKLDTLRLRDGYRRNTWEIFQHKFLHFFHVLRIGDDIKAVSHSIAVLQRQGCAWSPGSEKRRSNWYKSCPFTIIPIWSERTSASSKEWVVRTTIADSLYFWMNSQIPRLLKGSKPVCPSDRKKLKKSFWRI